MKLKHQQTPSNISGIARVPAALLLGACLLSVPRQIDTLHAAQITRELPKENTQITYSKILRILVLGDSLSDGFRLPDYNERFSGMSPSAYPSLLLRKIDAEIPGSEMQFVGGAGAELEDMLAYSQNLPNPPDLVVLWAGTNEVLAWARYGKDNPTDPEIFKIQYYALIANLKLSMQYDCKEVPIVVGTIHNLSWIPDYNSWASDKKERVEGLVQEYNLSIRTIAELHGIPVVGFDRDISPFKKGKYIWDGIHPSAELQQAIANTWWQTLGPMIKSAQKE